MKKSRKIIALVLSALMTVTMMPSMAFSATTNELKTVKGFKAVSEDNETVSLSWKKVSKATKYVVWGSKSGQTLKKISTIKGRMFTVKKINNKKLKANKSYRFRVVAYKDTKKIAKSKIVNITMPGKERTLEYKISFDANGGGGTMETMNVKEGSEVNLAANSFVAPTNKAFSGWNTSADGSGTEYSDKASVSIDGNLTLYAQWEDAHGNNAIVAGIITAAVVGAGVIAGLLCKSDDDDVNKYEIDSDGAWYEKGHKADKKYLLENTDAPYATALDNEGQPTEIIELTEENVESQVGSATIVKNNNNITYANNNGTAQTVVIRTTSVQTNLTVNAPHDVLEHYDKVGALNIEAIATESFHEHGQVAFAEIATGRIVLEKQSEVEHIHLAVSGDCSIIVAKDQNAKMPEFSRDPVEIPDGGKLIVALQDGTDINAEKSYLWLTVVGIYEQITVSDSPKGAGSTYATSLSGDTDKQDVAHQIANNITFADGGKDYRVSAQTADSGANWSYNAVDQKGDKQAGYKVEMKDNTIEVKTTGDSPATVTTKNENGLTSEEKEKKKESAVTEAEGKEGLGDAYGFNNTYIVEADGTSPKHWVHEITNAEEFRNIMDSTKHEKKNGQFDYPGAGEKETEYAIMNDIDFGGVIYTSEQIEEVKVKPFTGILKGNEMVTLSNVHLNDVMNSATTTNKSIWGLFDGVLNASFESLTLDDFTMSNSEGKVCGFLAAGQEKQNISGSAGFDSSAYVKVKDVTVNANCSINVNANAGSFFGNARNLDLVALENCENNAEVIIAGGNVGGFIGNTAYDSLDIGNANFETHSIVVSDCVNNGHIRCGSTGYASGLIGYNLHTGTINGFTNNGVIEVVGGGNKNVGVASGQTPNSTLVIYTNVVQNSYIKHTGNKPLHDYENKSEKMQVYHIDGDGILVSGFNGENAPTDAYKNLAYSSSEIVELELSFDETGKIKVADNSLNNVAKITVSLSICAHTAQPDGTCYNRNSAPNYQVFYETIAPTDGTTAVLNTKGYKKVNQIGYFAPEDITPAFGDDWGRIAKYCEQFRLDSDLYGTEGYTNIGYGVNSKGGYVLVRNIHENGFTVITPLHEDPHFTVTAYDANDNIIGNGMLYSGRIVGEHIPEDIHVTAGIDKYVYSK